MTALYGTAKFAKGQDENTASAPSTPESTPISIPAEDGSMSLFWKLSMLLVVFGVVAMVAMACMHNDGQVKKDLDKSMV